MHVLTLFSQFLLQHYFRSISFTSVSLRQVCDAAAGGGHICGGLDAGHGPQAMERMGDTCLGGAAACGGHLHIAVSSSACMRSASDLQTIHSSYGS